ncbi:MULTISPECIES: SsrA-binding protein SmpB [Thermaerobacter]|uniref:SsrA-binding protein n=1 Tax=Thermaerobacter composti TaxID=554949 RepID=A0ABZ0QP10_9FIRM|nr:MULTISPECIES: SsrA-binding protein SmpB [Thermaerobacter]PZN08443.1 MAG: SsrA-binding protein [Bacillota bacterium]QBS36977.1 SsrA-binding protein SmpB [Thermaerobacter sp. FW80]WPD18979.1 SsrA-binding protein SmpB [Thermaerobacter composti]
MAGRAEGVRLIADNRKARHDYFIDETFEAGLVLTGTEIKSIRAGRVNLRDSHARVEGGEVWLYGMHIAPYEHGNRFNHEPDRPRKLLLHRREIDYLAGRVRERGYTLVPLRLYLKGGWAKVELALARGKKRYDKRAAIAQREAQRRMAQALRARR